jgi:four helix bundle protein
MKPPQRIRWYRDLLVWQRAMALVVGTYNLTRSFPSDERFGLSSQLRRAAVSVPANIAEGHGRVHRGEYVHHLSIARGSLYEVETMLLLSLELGLSKASVVAPLLETSSEVGRMLGALLRALQRPKGNETDPRKAIPNPPDP